MPPRTAKVAETVPKVKKVPSGPIREKQRTMDKLIAAVGKVLQKKGYGGLKIANVAAEAGVDKKLIYLYFGSLDKLIETFMGQRDFWNSTEKELVSELLEKADSLSKEDIIALLHAQHDKLSKDGLYRKALHWELGEKTPALRKIANTREDTEEALWTALDKDFKKSGVDIRAVLALQTAGLNYLVLHAKTNGSTVYGLDVNKPADKERINAALNYIVDAAYSNVVTKPKAAAKTKAKSTPSKG